MPTIRRSRALPTYEDVELIDTQTVPTTAAELVADSIDVISMMFVNVGGQPNPKIRLIDGNGKSFIFYDAPVSPGFPLGYEEKPDGLRCTGGLTWSCDTASAVEGKIEYRKVL